MLGSTIDGFEIVRLIGEGGMGQVYEARELSTGRRVALKTLREELASDGEMLARFINEARAIKLVSHLGVCEVYRVGPLPRGGAYIAMEFIEGESLRRTLASGRLPRAQLLRVAQQVAATLAVVHEKKIIHRDLKPENIMLLDGREGEPRVKVLDFGIAKVSTLTQAQTEIRTRTGSVFGTPTYMSPEQIGGEGTISDKTDVYALGVLLYELVAGRPPFVGELDSQIMGRHLFAEPAPLRDTAADVPAELALLVHAMLAKKPEQRPSMAIAAEILALIAESRPMSQAQAAALRFAREAKTLRITPPAAGALPSRWASGPMRWAAPAAVLGCATLAFVLSRAVSPRPSPEPPPAPAPAPPRKVRWTINSTPPGATVVRVEDDAELGNTPFVSERIAAPGTVVLRLRLAGHQPLEITLPLNEDVTRDALLVADAPAPRKADKGVTSKGSAGVKAPRKPAPAPKTEPKPPEPAPRPADPVPIRPTSPSPKEKLRAL
ncbi:MAG: serine/threonine-protein kinase [Polyangia bacterium]